MNYPPFRLLILFSRYALALAFSAVLLTIFYSTAFAAGQLTGHITNVDDLPIAKVPVVLHRCHLPEGYTDCFWIAFRDAVTDANGDYILPLDGIETGNYRLSFNGWQVQYEGEFYPDKTSMDDAQNIPLTSDTVLEINAELASYGKVVGVVTNSDNQPLADIEIAPFMWIRADSGEYWNSFPGTRTDENGEYILPLRPGTFSIWFWAVYGGQYMSEYYADKYAMEEMDKFDISPGQTITLNAELSRLSTISGRVVDLNGKPVSNIEAQLYSWTSINQEGAGYWQGTPWSTITPDSGVYSMTVSPGSYRVGFHQPTNELAKYPLFFYPNTFDVNQAETVEIGTEVAITNINVALGNFGIIHGRVTDVEGNPLQATVELSKEKADYFPLPITGMSDEDGYFSIEVREPGLYYVQIIADQSQTTFARLFYEDELDFRKADGVVINPNQVVPLTIRVRPATSARGKVTDIHGKPIAGVDVSLYFPGFSDIHATTNSQGDYVIRSIPPGDYTMVASHPDYQKSFFSGYLTGGPIRDTIYIRQTTSAIQINFRLLNEDEEIQDFQSLYGVVVNQDNQAVPAIMVRAYLNQGSEWIEAGSDYTDAAGGFTIPTTNQGPYRLFFEDATFGENNADYTSMYYPNKRVIEDAEDIQVDDQYVGTNATLYDMPDILGRVTNERGVPIPNASVMAYHVVEANGQSQWQCCAAETTTGRGGDYELSDLPPGTYRLFIRASGPGYVNEYYGDVTTLEQAAEIPIAFGQGADSKDVVLTQREAEIEDLFLPSLDK